MIFFTNLLLGKHAWVLKEILINDYSMQLYVLFAMLHTKIDNNILFVRCFLYRFLVIIF